MKKSTIKRSEFDLEDLDQLRDEIDTEIKIFEYDKCYLLLVGRELTLVEDRESGIYKQKLGFVKGFEIIDDLNYLVGKEIEKHNQMGTNRDFMPDWLFEILKDELKHYLQK